MMFPAFWNAAQTEVWSAALANHLWQSTVVVLIAWLLTLLLRVKRALTHPLLWTAVAFAVLPRIAGANPFTGQSGFAGQRKDDFGQDHLLRIFCDSSSRGAAAKAAEPELVSRAIADKRAKAGLGHERAGSFVARFELAFGENRFSHLQAPSAAALFHCMCL